ncbi:MAG: cytochrome c [Myxococcota bacterium]|nr:cytochrome c [Myxococcota bacterium]
MLLAGCSGSSEDSGGAVVVDPVGSIPDIELGVESGELLTENVRECDAVVGIEAHRFLCQTADGVWFIDEAKEEPTWLGDHRSMAAAAMSDGVLLVLDGKPFLFDGHEAVPFGLPTPVPVESAVREGGAVWLTGAGRVFRYADNVVTEFAVDGHPFIFGHTATEDRLHVAVPELVTLDVSGAEPTVVAWSEMVVDSMAADERGDLWVVSDGQLFVQRGTQEPVAVAMPEAVRSVVGPAIWIEGETESYRYRDGAFTAFPLVAVGTQGVDEYGRLLQVREGAFRRHSSGRPVVVVGLPDSVTVASTVRLLPSDPTSLDELRVWVDAAEIPVSMNPYRITLDPEAMAEGQRTLRFFTQSARGEALSEHGVWVGELADVAWDDVAGISEAHCIHCHGGQTLTDLSGPSDWESHIDSIIEVVTMQDMPLGGPYLSEEEITMIRAWKHGGFQP